ncbi:DUF3093 domain-containing protein [Saccharomonospora sp.]|uniref:DUF3093 domain-containing protein n=1 Tax=Saccharomonospora sp. TaxID=33913 RepID=UPI0026347200|nr:DUF3093 domain-containing protein [Saccharomonospora sp.]
MTNNAHTRTKADLRHSERLFVPLWHWPLPLIAAALLAAQVHYGYPSLPVWLPYVVFLVLAVAVTLVLGRTRIAVNGTDEPRLWVGDANLPLRYIAAVDVVSHKDKRQALGPELDPAAFCVHKPWIRTMVRVYLDDPEDPTPYWIFSTRHPERLATLLSNDGDDTSR